MVFIEAHVVFQGILEPYDEKNASNILIEKGDTGR